MVLEEMSSEEFQDGRHGGHLGYRNGMTLPILNLCLTVMLPLSFSSIGLTAWEKMSFEEFQDGRHCGHNGYRNERFSNSESLCHCEASYQVLAQSDLRFGRRCRWKNFKMDAMAAILDIATERF